MKREAMRDCIFKAGALILQASILCSLLVSSAHHVHSMAAALAGAAAHYPATSALAALLAPL
jgi:hypothetical protein